MERWIETEQDVKLMLPFGEVLVLIDTDNSLHVYEVSNGKWVLQIDPTGRFVVTAITHPATYLNKVLVGSSEG